VPISDKTLSVAVAFGFVKARYLTLFQTLRKREELKIRGRELIECPKCQAAKDRKIGATGREVCAECLDHFCPDCACSWHTGLTCEQVQQQRRGEDIETIKMLVMCQRCPGCKARVHKVSGCNHMQHLCPVRMTHVHWCAVCGMELQARNSSIDLKGRAHFRSVQGCIDAHFATLRIKELVRKARKNDGKSSETTLEIWELPKELLPEIYKVKEGNGGEKKESLLPSMEPFVPAPSGHYVCIEPPEAIGVPQPDPFTSNPFEPPPQINPFVSFNPPIDRPFPTPGPIPDFTEGQHFNVKPDPPPRPLTVVDMDMFLPPKNDASSTNSSITKKNDNDKKGNSKHHQKIYDKDNKNDKGAGSQEDARFADSFLAAARPTCHRPRLAHQRSASMDCAGRMIQMNELSELFE